jgi:hypothetical protein
MSTYQPIQTYSNDILRLINAQPLPAALNASARMLLNVSMMDCEPLIENNKGSWGRLLLLAHDCGLESHTIKQFMDKPTPYHARRFCDTLTAKLSEHWGARKRSIIGKFKFNESEISTADGFMGDFCISNVIAALDTSVALTLSVKWPDCIGIQINHFDASIVDVLKPLMTSLSVAGEATHSIMLYENDYYYSTLLEISSENKWLDLLSNINNIQNDEEALGLIKEHFDEADIKDALYEIGGEYNEIDWLELLHHASEYYGHFGEQRSLKNLVSELEIALSQNGQSKQWQLVIDAMNRLIVLSEQRSVCNYEIEGSADYFRLRYLHHYSASSELIDADANYWTEGGEDAFIALDTNELAPLLNYCERLYLVGVIAMGINQIS